MRPDANKIALRAARAVLDGARSVELDVAGTKVSCQVSRSEASWPEKGVEGLDEQSDGPWPAPVDMDCRWQGGRCVLRAKTWYWQTKGRYRHQVGMGFGLRDRARELVWVTIPPAINDTADGETASIQAFMVLVKRKDPAQAGRTAALNRALKEAVATSDLPRLSESRIDAFGIQIPDGAVLPSGEAAFRRLLHLALFKLEFMDRGPAASDRGRPLLDVKALTGVEPSEGGDDPTLPTEPGDDVSGLERQLLGRRVPVG